ncbi:DMT family transporter [Marinobacterium sediminicola]|uniref:Threonine/homoserine efflux transporter RhtA n=1 Tax=Marinobacterium sediminicola TaxID=518898 RepID=A0ABY1RWN1_9GAMM|nr:DMT family transporter [Marinobacterium sediminicola]ULG70247.1 DMT family transporter [Marinobacterium sediminicola]SMR69970.1 Threonine/homoserine efflux transporter RhtA [Marinobacterium sediminicola]
MPYLLLILTTLFWAGNFVLARAIHLDMQPFTLAFLRWALALLIIAPWWLPRAWKMRQTLKANLPVLAVQGILGVACFNTLVYFGVQYTQASNAMLMQSAVPLMILLLGALMFGERASGRQWLGVVLSLGGVMVLVSRGQLEVLTGFAFNEGDLWIFLAMLSWSLYTISLRWRPAVLDGLTFFGFSVLVGVVVLFPLMLWEQGGRFVVPTTEPFLLTVLYMAIFPSILSFLFWNLGVERLGAATAGLFIHLMPMFGLLLATVFLGESLGLYHLVGILLIFTGLYIAILAQSLRRLSKTT